MSCAGVASNEEHGKGQKGKGRPQKDHTRRYSESGREIVALGRNDCVFVGSKALAIEGVPKGQFEMTFDGVVGVYAAPQLPGLGLRGTLLVN